MRTDADLDRLHDTVVARFPDGINQMQFRIVTLESADDDDDGRVYPHSIADMMRRYSWLIGMWFDGLLEHCDDGSGRPRWHQPVRYKITEKGRAWLAENRGGVSSSPRTEQKS